MVVLNTTDLLSMLSQEFYVTIDCCVRTPGHVRDVVDGLNSTDKSFFFKLMVTVPFPGEKLYDTQMIIHSATSTEYFGLSQ